MADLPPGPELDALVAEKVMGWTEATAYHHFYAGPGLAWDDGTPCFRHKDLWRPSTDIAAAFEVVEKLRPNYWLELKSPFFAKQPWFAGFTRTGETGWNGVPDNQKGTPTAPHAICLAALRAVGGA